MNVQTQRPHLAVALLCSLAVAGLLGALVASAGSAAASDRSSTPRLYDEPFRGAPRNAH
jgi:hypothetical protein